MLEKAEAPKEPEHQIKDLGNENVPGGKSGDSAIRKLLEEDETEKSLKKAEKHAAQNAPTSTPI